MSGFKVTMDTRHMDAQVRDLERMGADVERAGVEALRRYARGDGLREVRQGTPRRTGNLRREWRAVPTARGARLDNREPYAGKVLWGRRHRNRTRQVYRSVGGGARRAVQDAVRTLGEDLLR